MGRWPGADHDMTATTTVAAGSVGPASFPRLLGRIYREKAHGRLIVEHDGGRSVAYFRKGRPVGVNVFTRFKPLGIVLLETGAIDVETLDSSLTLKAERDCLHGEILKEMDAINEEQLLVGLRKQHQDNLRALLQIRDGSYELESGGELPVWTEQVGLSAQETVLTHLSDETFEDAVRALIRLLGGTRFVLTPLWKAGWVSFEMSREEHGAMETFAEPKSIEEAASEAAVDVERIAILVAATSCFGLVAGAR